MGYLEIAGGTPLCGELEIQGSKNAVLPLLAGCIPGEGVCEIVNCPAIADVEDTLKLLQLLGCRAWRRGSSVLVDASRLDQFEIKAAQASRIRSSVLFLGALLGKMKKAVLPMPGGCAIGSRPIDLHLAMLSRLGAEFSITETIEAKAVRLTGTTLQLPLPSVGTTENLILASVQAEGTTIIERAAQEPEIDELCRFLNCRGAVIDRTPDGSIRIEGGHPLGGVRYFLHADRIVTGTYLLAAEATGGSIRIRNAQATQQQALLQVLKQMGAAVQADAAGIALQAGDGIASIPYLETAPYPGFPTDLQSPLMAALCRAGGDSRICERMFENRFRTAAELTKMGAQICCEGNTARITGVEKLHPAILTSPDLRGGAALVIAALQTEGRTRIERTGFIERGYEDICRDLQTLGATIEKLE